MNNTFVREEFRKKVTCHKPWSEVERNTHISLKNDYSYFQVSKAASSTVKYYLQLLELDGSPWEANVVNVNKKFMSPHLSPFQLRKNEFEVLMNDSGHKKITFVRNPYTRLLSCYLHRIIGQPSSKSAKVLKRVMEIDDVSKITFRDFIKCICGQDSKDMEGHWRVQYDEIIGSLIKFDFIGKQENLMADIQAMIELLGGDPKRLGIDDKNESPMVTGASKKIKEYYTDELLGLVSDRYHHDFELLGYRKEV